MKCTYNEDLEQYEYLYGGILFVWENEPGEETEELVKTLAQNYRTRLDSIVEFMLPDIKEIYGVSDPEEIKEKLGRPQIDYDMGQLTYLEHVFDYIHIFTIEFNDDKFEDLQYFSIDG